MTLSSLLAPSAHSPPHPHPGLMHATNMDRTEWSAGGAGVGGGWKGWKGGKGDPNASLSALTLLAFLFFLNILQHCLKDTIGNHNPNVMMMMLPTTEATMRHKRETDPETTTTYDNWTDIQITNLVHNQVESYWSSSDAMPRKINLKNEHKTYKSNSETTQNSWSSTTYPELLRPKNKISTKLSMTKTKDPRIVQSSKNTKRQVNKIYLKKATATGTKTKLFNSLWMNVVKAVSRSSRPHIEKALCCDMILCQEKKLQKDVGSEHSGIAQLIRQSVSWLCSEPPPGTCDKHSAQQCHSPLARSLIHTVSFFLETL